MSLVAKTIACVIVGAALTISPHAPVSTDIAPRAEAATPADAPGTDNGKAWTEADLVCEIDGDVWAVDIDTEEPEKVLLIKDATNPSVRPGTRDIAFVRGDDIWLWSAGDASQKEIATDVLSAGFWARSGSPPGIEGKLAWHPGGRWLAFSTYRPLTWQAEDRMPRACGYYDHLDAEWRRVSWFEFLYLLDIESGTCYELVGPDTDTGPEHAMLGAHSPAWSPSGDGLAFTRLGDAWELEFFQLPEQGKRNASWYCRRVGAVASLGSGQHASNASGGAREVCYSPSGRGIIVNYGRLGGTGWGETKVIPLWDQEGKKHKNPLDPWLKKIMDKLGGDFCGPVISADGKRVAFSWGKLWVYEWPSTDSRMIVDGGNSPSWIEIGREQDPLEPSLVTGWAPARGSAAEWVDSTTDMKAISEAPIDSGDVPRTFAVLAGRPKKATPNVPNYERYEELAVLLVECDGKGGRYRLVSSYDIPDGGSASDESLSVCWTIDDWATAAIGVHHRGMNSGCFRVLRVTRGEREWTWEECFTREWAKASGWEMFDEDYDWIPEIREKQSVVWTLLGSEYWQEFGLKSGGPAKGGGHYMPNATVTYKWIPDEQAYRVMSVIVNPPVDKQ